MARTHGRLFCSIWSDDDFLAISPEAKNVFSFLLSQEDLSHAGTIIMRVPLWAELIGYSDEQTEAALDELHATRFAVVDRRRFELLVRSVVRRDGVYKQPNVYKSAIESMRMVRSRPIRAALAQELARLDDARMNAEIQKAHADIIDWLRRNSDGPAPNPSAKGSGKGSPNPVCPESEFEAPEGPVSDSPVEAMSEIRYESMIDDEPVDNCEPADQGTDSKGSAKGSAKGYPPRAISTYHSPHTKEEPLSPTATPPADQQMATKPKRSMKRKAVAEPRPDVEALCTRLADLMVANGCNRPTISDTWRREARLLLDNDHRDFQKAMNVLEWSQRDPFWHANIHSIAKFRKQYDRLRQKALLEWQASHPGAADEFQPYSDGAQIIQINRQRTGQSDLGGDDHMQRFLERARIRREQTA